MFCYLINIYCYYQYNYLNTSIQCVIPLHWSPYEVSRPLMVMLRTSLLRPWVHGLVPGDRGALHPYLFAVVDNLNSWKDTGQHTDGVYHLKPVTVRYSAQVVISNLKTFEYKTKKICQPGNTLNILNKYKKFCWLPIFFLLCRR